MTNPVILLGTQSNGETLPVQVDDTGRLVAEGLQGPQGEKGDKGDQGDQGPKGEDGGTNLPPNPNEGDVLGWQNNQLAWISLVPPVPELLWSGSYDPSPSGQRRVISASGAGPLDPGAIDDGWWKGQSFFPDGADSEVGFGTTGGENTDWWELDILNCTGMILSVNYWYRFATFTNGAPFSFNAIPVGDGLTQISGAIQDLGIFGSGGWVYREGRVTFAYLINSSELLNQRFNIQASTTSVNLDEQRAYLQGFKVEEPQRYFRRKLKERRNLVASDILRDEIST